jgi:hypothetical protein
MVLFLLGLLWPLPAPAQNLQLYSEFRRVDAKGAILRQDLGGTPREILSPGFARNAWHSMRLVLRPVKGKWYTLWVTQNPPGLNVKLYRELPAAPNSPVHDRLEQVRTPVQGQGTGEAETIWLDVFVPAFAEVKRIRLEAQFHDGDQWFTYPMEVRILAAIVPRFQPAGGPIAAWAKPSDATARQTLREYMCGDKPMPGGPRGMGRALTRRNVQQDIALAQALEAKWGKQKLQDSIAQAAGAGSAAAWCSAPPAASPYGPEWYLKVRDLLYREASRW